MGAVARQNTPLSAAQAAEELPKHLEHFGISQSAAPLLLALVWLETGRGNKMQNHNWGNITGSYQGNFWRPPWFEVGESSSAEMIRLHERMLEGTVPSQFRAYPSSSEGAHDFVEFLKTAGRGRFTSMVETAEADDPDAFAQAYKSTGYNPDAQPDREARTFRGLRDELAPLFAEAPKPKTGPGWRAVIGLGVLLGGMGALYFVTKGVENGPIRQPN